MAAVRPILPNDVSAPSCCAPRLVHESCPRGNNLGFQIPPSPPKCGGHAFGVGLPSGLPKPPCFPCSPPSTTAHPLSYESDSLQPYQTLFDGDHVLFMNTLKTLAYGGFIYTLARGQDPFTSNPVTLLSRVQASDTTGTTRKTVNVQYTDAANPANSVPLTFGSSMTALGKFIYIVGFNGGLALFTPVIARVHVDTLDVLVWQGNGETSDFEVYTDVTVGFCIPGISTEPLLAVCGFIRLGFDVRASLRLINLDTMLPIAIPGTELTYNSLDEISVSVSIVANSALGIYNILYDTYDLKCAIWSVSSNGSSLATTLQYNDPATQTLRTSMGVALQWGIQLACRENGTLFALVRGFLESTSADMPSEVTMVYQFTPDTNPAVGFGVSGIVVWWDPSVGPSIPSALRLSEYGEEVYVVGNSFSRLDYGSGNSLVISPNVLSDLFSFLRIFIPRSESNPVELAAYPVPFVIRIAETNGCVGLVLRGSPNCPCSDFQFAVDVCFTSPKVLLVSGMVAKDLLATPAIVSGLLTMVVSLHTNPARVLNCTPITVNILNGYCNGIVGINNPCAPTTALQIQGPVVVGNSSNPPLIPGTIRFQDGQLLVYNGAIWQPLAYAENP